MSENRAVFGCVFAGVLAFGSGCVNLSPMSGNADDGSAGGAPTGEKSFFASLSGGQEVPPVDVTATGEAALTLNDNDTEIALDISATGITGGVTGMHLHRAAAGENGDIVLDLTGTVIDFGGGRIGASGSVPISSETISALRDGTVYLNLHTENNPAGEIRGQFGPPS